MVTEERIITLEKNRYDDYLAILKSDVLPSLRSAGGRVLCILQGLIGSTSDSLTQFTIFENLESWQTAQGAWISEHESSVQNQSVRLLRTLGSRPTLKTTIPPEARRRIYQYERSIISSSDLSEFVLCNEEGVWPEMEQNGASILGMWTLSSTGSPLEIITLTGFESVSHWDKLYFKDIAQHDSNIWDRELQLINRLKVITKTSRLELMISAE